MDDYNFILSEDVSVARSSIVQIFGVIATEKLNMFWQSNCDIELIDAQINSHVKFNKSVHLI